MTATLEDVAPVGPAPTGRRPAARRRGSLGSLLVLLPFWAYVAVFLLLPTGIVAVGAFQGRDGRPTLANFDRLFEANTVDAFVTSTLVSAASALAGGVIGALAAYVLVTGAQGSSVLRRVVLALSGVLAQFGGVMLAFAFIATVGINGTVTRELADRFGYTMDPTWISSMPGLITIYTYFQVPLMIIVFLPAVQAVRPQYREACENLGGSTWTYWRHVGGPILLPRFLGAVLLLFANAFSAYATAAALFAQRSILVPLMIQGALRNEQDLGQNGFAQVLAFAMVVVVGLVMAAYAWLQNRTSRWER